MRNDFFAFSRIAYGIAKTRCDGRRLLVYSDSDVADLKEAYCCELDASGAVRRHRHRSAEPEAGVCSERDFKGGAWLRGPRPYPPRQSLPPLSRNRPRVMLCSGT